MEGVNVMRATRVQARAKDWPRVAEVWVMPVLGILTLLGGWAALSASGWISPKFLPGPMAVLQRMAELTQEPYAGALLQQHLLASLEKFLLSFSIAVLVGVPLGLAMGRSKRLEWVVAPLFEAFRFIPPIAWVPFAIFWFGTGFLSPTLVIFAGAFAPCVLNAYRGARQIEKHLLEAGQMLGAGRWLTFTEILLPAALTHIVAGMRVGAGFGWQSLIGAELIVGSTGLGYMIVKGGSNLEPTVVMSGMIAIGLAGAAIDWCMRMLQARTLRSAGMN
ncbi:taurine ABC transporter permease TauC [Comamonas humi]